MDDPLNAAAAWRSRSGELAAYFWRLFVNRTDVWGSYVSIARRKVRTRADGTTHVMTSVTAPPVRLRGLRTLTPGILTRHFGGHDVGFLIGLHTTSAENTSRWGLIEVDRHGPVGDADANRKAVLYWYRLLRRLGFRPWLSDSNGRGGYHLLVLFDRPVPTEKLYRFLRRLVRNFRRFKLAGPPEHFPKQPSVAPGKCGNWVRLPGRHHTRDHWTRFWDGMRWVAGAEAVDFILESRPDSVDRLPDLPPDGGAAKAVPIPQPRPPAGPDRAHAAIANSSDRPRMTPAEVALRCLAHIRNNDVHYDDWLAVGMALHSADSSASMLSAWDRWSAASGKHVAGECGRCWAAFSTAGRERRYTVGTLVHLARRAGFDPFPRRRVAKPEPPTPRRVATSLQAPAAHAAAAGPFAARRSGRGVA